MTSLTSSFGTTTGESSRSAHAAALLAEIEADPTGIFARIGRRAPFADQATAAVMQPGSSEWLRASVAALDIRRFRCLAERGRVRFDE